MRRAARVDRNHAEVRETLRRCGWRVIDASSFGNGVADLFCMRGAAIRMVEVKSKSGKLTPRQAALIAEGWPIVIIRDVNEAARLQ